MHAVRWLLVVHVYSCLTIMPANSPIGTIEGLGKDLVRILRSRGLLARIGDDAKPLIPLRISLESKAVGASRLIRGNDFHGMILSLHLLSLVAGAVDRSFQRSSLLVEVIDAEVVCFVHGHQMVHFEIFAKSALLRDTSLLERIFRSRYVRKFVLTLLFGLCALLYRLNQSILVGIWECLRENFQKIFDDFLHPLLLRIIHRIT